MAAFYLFMRNPNEFFEKIYKERDPELILKIVKCVLNAVKRKKSGVDVFEITFKNTDQLIYSVEKSQYLECLNSYVNDLIKMDTTETYMLCAKIQKLNNPKRLTYKSSDNEKKEPDSV